MKTAKIFSNGRSLAVRIPRKWLGSTEEVEMNKKGDIIEIRPKRKTVRDIANECAKDPVSIERLAQTYTESPQI